MDVLTISQQERLTDQERIVRGGLQAFYDVGEALSVIRDEKLYRLDYDTFEDYCQSKWGMSRTYAHRLIKSADVIDNLLPTGNKPEAERQVRPLTQLPPEQQAEAWQQATDTAPNGKITAKHVQETVDQLKEQSKAAPKPANYITLEDWAGGVRDLGNQANTTMNKTNDNIEWAGFSWNPVTGCLHNCKYCYARDIANRFFEQGFTPSFIPERLSQPANTKQVEARWDGDIGYKNVFTCSMADLFGKWVPAEWIEAVLNTIENNPQWTFLLLSKFPVRMAEFTYPDNVWLGTSCDYQHTVQRAESAFTKIKASGFNGICWLSCEPMMERITFNSLDMFDWVVMGGSSKSTQTPEYYPPFDDIIHLYDQARAAGSKVYFKTNLLSRIREYPHKLQLKTRGSRKRDSAI